MEEKLNNIAKIIEDYFVREVWYTIPPIKDIDYKLLLLASKIYELKNTIKNINDIDHLEEMISEITTYIEKEFNVPMLSVNIPLWIEEDKIRNKIVLTVYNQLSSLISS